MSNVFPKSEDKFPALSNLTSSGNKVRLQKLVKEQLKSQVCRVQGEVYYEGKMSTNLTTGIAIKDYVFKNPEIDTMMLS